MKKNICLYCGKDISDAADSYAMCSADNVNDIRGDVCEDCYEKHSDKELFKKTGLVVCDSYSDELLEHVKVWKGNAK